MFHNLLIYDNNHLKNAYFVGLLRSLIIKM